MGLLVWRACEEIWGLMDAKWKVTFDGSRAFELIVGHEYSFECPKSYHLGYLFVNDI